jgi:Uma2 family endonuclease
MTSVTPPVNVRAVEQQSSKLEPPRRLTAAELLQLSNRDHKRYALIRGELITMAPAGAEHGARASSLGARMQVFAEDHELGIVFAAETGFQLEVDPDTILAPDAAFVRQARLPAGPLPAGYFPGAPDIAVEVVSPGDTQREVADKVAAWLEHGTHLVWVLRSRQKTVTVHRLDGTVQVLGENDLLDGEDVLPGFRIPIKHLFR